MKSARCIVTALLVCAFTLASTSSVQAALCGGTTTCNCNDSITSNYTMHADLNCSGSGVNSDDALKIFNRSNITLDCNGYNITGGDVLGANGISVDGDGGIGSSNIKVKNCQVSHFDRGISVKDSTVVELSANTSDHNLWYGIEIADTEEAPDTTFVSVLNSFILNNGDEGVHVGGKSGVVPEHEVTGNTVSENNCEGIYIADLSGTLTPSRIFGVRVLSNSVFGNGIGGGPQSCAAGNPGILLNNSNVNKVRYNSLTHDNFGVSASSNNTIGNQVINFGRVKFEASSNSNELTRVCVLGDYTSPAEAFVFVNSSSNTCAACTAIRPDDYHIVTSGTSSGNTFTNLRIAPDTSVVSSGSGFTVNSISTGSLPCME